MENQETKPKRAKRPRLTKKQKVFVAEYAVSENGADAAKKAYEIKGSNENKIAASIATQNLAKPSIQDAVAVVQESLKEALITEGITPKRIAEKVNVLLNAKEKVFRNNVSTGEIEEIGERTDFTAVDKGLKHATAIYGIAPDGGSRPASVTYNFLFSKEVQERINFINGEFKRMLSNANAKED